MPYITYLTNQSQTNRAASHAGFGWTEEESAINAEYWPNQLPWVRTVAFSRAPKWAVKEARQAYHANCIACGKVHPIEHKQTTCIDKHGYVLSLAKDWPTEVKVYEF